MLFTKKKTNWIKKNHSRLNQHDSTSWQCVQINSACVQLNQCTIKGADPIEVDLIINFEIQLASCTCLSC